MVPLSRRAVFLDRDGVLNRNIFYVDTGCFESPRTAQELALCTGAAASLLRLKAAGFLLILVSNQPNAAKGKCSREELDLIAARLVSELDTSGLALDASYYCYHHPDHTATCVCRKPEPYFLYQAAEAWQLNLADCWMIGDRASDIECGRRAHTSTILMDTGEGPRVGTAADFRVSSLEEASRLIVSQASRRDQVAGVAPRLGRMNRETTGSQASRRD